MNKLHVKVKYIDPKMKHNSKYKLRHIGGNKKSCWIDVRASRIEINGQAVEWKWDNDGVNIQTVSYNKGDYLRVYLGFAMELPEGYEALTAPRGSTFSNFRVIQTNSPGVVDESYKGDKDEWFIPFFALQDGVIGRLDRVAQFRIQEKMPELDIEEVDHLNNPDRGGHGGTGTR